MPNYLRKNIAMLCALALTGTSLPAFRAAALTPVPVPPDWVPADYESTVEFLNNHGATYVADGYICYIITEQRGYSYFQKVLDAEDGSQYKDFTVIAEESYRFEVPEDPGELPEDAGREEAKAYYKKLEEYERFQRMAGDLSEEDFEALPTYHVITMLPTRAGTFTINIDCIPNGLHEPLPVAEYRFEMSSESLEQIDRLRWMPDCVREFDAYVEEYGMFSVQDGLMVFAAEYNASTGETLLTGENGSGLYPVVNTQISRVNPMPMIMVSGESSRVLQLYRPESEELTHFGVYRGRDWAPQASSFAEVAAIRGVKMRDGSYHAEFVPRLIGDFNADGALDMRDFVLFNRFLTADTDFNLVQMLVADVSEDYRVNAIDMTVLKELALSDGRKDFTPIDGDLIGKDDPIRIDDPTPNDPIPITDPIVAVTDK